MYAIRSYYALMFRNRNERNDFLEYTNANGVQTRPIWTLMHKLDPYKNYQHDDLSVSEYFDDRLVNIPSSVRI